MFSRKIVRLLVLYYVSSSISIESCTSLSENEVPHNISAVDTIAVSVYVHEIPWNQLIADVKVIPLKTLIASTINSVHQSSLFDKKLYIFDRRAERLLVFDRFGKYIGDVGKKGRGPGEFQSLRYFGIDTITQHVFILNYRNILEFDSTFKFVRDHKIDIGNNSYIHPLYFLRISDTILYIWCDGFEGIDKINPAQKKFHLHELINGKIINSKVEIGCMNFGKNRFVQSKFIYIMPPENEYDIRKVDKNGIHGAHYIDFGNKAIPNSTIKQKQTFNSSTLIENDRMRNCKSISNFIETDSHIFFNFRYGIIEYNVIKNLNNGNVFASPFVPKLYNSIPFRIIGYDNITKSFVAIIEPFNIKKFQLDFENSGSVDCLNILKQLASLEEYQNPVILLLKLKP